MALKVYQPEKPVPEKDYYFVLKETGGDSISLEMVNKHGKNLQYVLSIGRKGIHLNTLSLDYNDVLGLDRDGRLEVI